MMEESYMHKILAVTAAVDVIAGNADLLSEILLRLPARSLIRFTLVCKPWCSIITSMQFRLSHCRTLAFSNALAPSGIYFYDCLTNLQKIESLPLADNVTGLPPIQFLDKMAPQIGDTVKITQVKVTQSCKGLLMCIFTARTGVGNRNIKLGVVYNPAIKEYRPLPSPYDKYYEYVSYNLINDPSEPPYYKALCVTRLSWDSEIDVSVYVPGSESWRYCCRSSAPQFMRFDSGIFWNGAIHWVGDYFSISFDANSEEVAHIKMPPSLQVGFSYNKIRYFGEWGGHLHLIQVRSLYAKKFDVLELDKDTRKWSVKYRVHLARLISAFPEMVQQTSGIQYAFSILSVIRGENEEDSVLLLTIPGKVVAYNLVLKTANVVRELSGEVGDTPRYNIVSAYQYSESLAPVKEWTISPK